MANDFDRTDGTMAPPWWSDQLILEVVVHHWDMDNVYTHDDTDDGIDDDHDDDTDDDNDHKNDNYTAAGAAPCWGGLGDPRPA